MAMATGSSAESSPTVRVLALLLCLAPIVYYLYKSRDRIFGRNDSRRRTPFVVLGAVLAFVMIGDVAIAAAGVGFPIVGDSNVKAAMVGGGASSSDSAESSSSASVSAADVKLAPVTEFLEYSNKDVDPVTLVTCNPSAQLTAKSKINLDTVGVQQVEYAVKAEDDSATFKVDFTVRDTKAPTINLSNSSLSIDQYADFDPAGSIASVSDVVDGALARVDAEPVARGASPGNEVFYDAGWYVIDGNVDPSAPGTYSLIVKAADKHGNVTTRELLVTVNEAAPVVAEEPAPAPAVHTYIANANTRKFHIPGCRDVAKMKDSNKVEITATRQEMLEWGYSPCGHCCP